MIVMSQQMHSMANNSRHALNRADIHAQTSNFSQWLPTLEQLQAEYSVPAYLHSPHLQTVWGSIISKPSLSTWQLESLALDDGDEHEIAFIGEAHHPLICMIPGMGGSWQSASISHGVPTLLARGYQLAVINHRGFGRKINKLARTTHAADYSAMAQGIRQIQRMRPGVPMYGIGFSLGGSQILHYLAHVTDAPLLAACAIAAPFHLPTSEQATPGYYQRFILRTIRQHYMQKLASGVKLPIDAVALKKLVRFRDYDRVITAPLHGFSDVDTYYQQASCRQYLSQVQHPCLLLSALDDPFYFHYELPQAADLGAQMCLLGLEFGGHLGYWSYPVGSQHGMPATAAHTKRATGRSKQRLQPYWMQVADKFFSLYSTG